MENNYLGQEGYKRRTEEGGSGHGPGQTMVHRLGPIGCGSSGPVDCLTASYLCKRERETKQLLLTEAQDHEEGENPEGEFRWIIIIRE